MKNYYSLLKIFLYLIFIYLVLTIVQGLGNNPAIRAIGLIAGILALAYFMPKLIKIFDKIPYFKKVVVAEVKKEEEVKKTEENVQNKIEEDSNLTMAMDSLTKFTDSFRISIEKNVAVIIIFTFLIYLLFRVLYLVIFKHIPFSDILF